jgi:hypothetical protein
MARPCWPRPGPRFSTKTRRWQGLPSTGDCDVTPGARECAQLGAHPGRRRGSTRAAGLRPMSREPLDHLGHCCNSAFATSRSTNLARFQYFELEALRLCVPVEERNGRAEAGPSQVLGRKPRRPSGSCLTRLSRYRSCCSRCCPCGLDPSGRSSRLSSDPDCRDWRSRSFCRCCLGTISLPQREIRLSSRKLRTLRVSLRR